LKVTARIPNLTQNPIEAYVKLSPGEAMALEGFRRGMARTVLPLLGMAGGCKTLQPKKLKNSSR